MGPQTLSAQQLYQACTEVSTLVKSSGAHICGGAGGGGGGNYHEAVVGGVERGARMVGQGGAPHGDLGSIRI